MTTDQFDNEDSLWDQLPGTEGRERAHLLLHIAGHRYQDDDFATGLTVAQEAASIYEALDDLRGLGLALEEVARGQNGVCEHTEAVATLKRAIELLTEHGEPGDLVDVYTGLGYLHRQQRRFDDAADAFHAAYTVLREESAPRQQALATTAEAMGRALAAIGGLDNLVVSYLDEAMSHGRGDASSHWMGRVARALARALHHQGEDERAREVLAANLTVARHCECDRCLADALDGLAHLDGALGDDAAALAGFTEAAAVAKKHSGGSPTPHDAHLHLFQSTVTDDYAEAVDHIDQAEALYTSMALDWDVANCTDYRGLLAERADDPDTALHYYVGLQARLVDMGDEADMAELVYKIARVHINRADASAAMTVLQGGGYVDDLSDTVESREVARHCALFARAKAANGETAPALRYAERVLHATSHHDWYEVQGALHEARARLLQHTDPAGSERAAQRSQACYNQAGDHAAATEIGYEFFIRPYEVLARIDVDNQARAEARDAERRVRAEDTARWEQEVVAASAAADPIESQIEQPDTGEANSA